MFFRFFYFNNFVFHKGSRQKNYFKREGGGGGKKELFWNFLTLSPLKNKNYFTLDNCSKYGHITLKFVSR